MGTTTWEAKAIGPVLAALVAVTAACGSAPGRVVDAGELTASVDWQDRTISGSFPLPDGWEVYFCEGDAPLLCVSDEGRPVGAVELLDWHLAALPDFSGDLGAWAHRSYDVIAQDRSAACGADYLVDGDEPTSAVVGGAGGIRSSFIGYAGTTAAERTIWYSVVLGDVQYVLAAVAYERDSCVAPYEGEFGVADLQAFEPTLAAIAAASRFPRPGGDGTVTARIQEKADGTVIVDPVVLLSGEEAAAAAREDGVLEPGETSMPNDVYLRNQRGATFRLTLGDADVQLYDCAQQACELRPVALGEFLDGAVQPFAREFAVYSVSVDDGVVVSISEVYLP